MKRVSGNSMGWLLVCSVFLPVMQCHLSRMAVEDTLIALYAGGGSDEDCVTATERMFQSMGYAVTRVDADYINSRGLEGFRLLCMPGGDMYQYEQDLASDGTEEIRQFIRNGGGYIGICGGAYFACQEVIWRGTRLPMTCLGLFSGSAEGPIDAIVPYPEYAMCKVDIVDHLHPITRSEPDHAWILYYWGPVLVPNRSATISILGRYDTVDEPAMVAFDYEYGRVFLIGPHPEFEEDSDRDGVSFPDQLDDRGSDWDLMQKTCRWCLGK